MFPGNVSEYLAKIDQDAKLSDSMARSAQSGTGLVNSAPQSDGLSAKERRQQAAALRQKLSPLRKRSEQLQGLILLKEGRVQELETAMTDPAFFKTSDAADATREHLQLKDEIEALYVEWEDCESEIAQLNEL